jgi:N-acetylmuramoyl-L-alanine amidase/type II secretory pathway predicted ATPase ExeA
MFLEFYGLHQQPFGVTPDPAYLYPSRTHCEALDSLTDGIMDARGFLALIAEPGMGKTTLLYQVLEGLRGKAKAAFLFQTQCNSREFFQYLLSELGVDATGMGLVAMHNKLNEMLFAEMLAGRRFVLIVDEAQNLDDSVLETIRLLSNFETEHTKLLQIVLAGQPQLGETLGHKKLSQLLQRIAVVQRLEALSPEETAGYIRHRLKVAGHSSGDLFDQDALAMIAAKSGGVPRTINNLCFHALQEGFAQGRRTLSVDIIEKADRKSKLEPGAPSEPPPAAGPAADSSKASAAPETSRQLTYKPFSKFGLHSWVLWACALAAIVLSAGAALAHNSLGAMMRIMRNPAKPIATSPSHRESSGITGYTTADAAELAQASTQNDEADDRLQTAGMRDVTDADQRIQLPRGTGGTPDVTAIQASSTQDDARVIVLLDDPVQYDSARISAPERIYFDLHNARLSPSVAQKTVPAQDGLLKWVRAAQNTDDVVRLVLNAEKAKAYSAQLLSDPYRLVIDVHAQAVPAGTVQPNVATASLAVASHETHPSLTQELGLKISRIAIDPGHGGYDTGAMGPHGLMEKNLCLDVALRLGQIIRENVPGAEVIYTRTTDKYVSLEDRTAIANRANADLFISIHANSSDSASARGVETYYLSLLASPESMKLATRENAFAQSSLHDLPEMVQTIARNAKIAESKLFAQDIQNALAARLQLVSRGETNRGVKRAPFVVLTGANMPAVLSEISFISNASDESLLLDSNQRQRVAESLYRGIETYLDGMNSLPPAKQKLVTENRPGAPGR